MTALIRSIVLAFVLAAGTAFAQQQQPGTDTPDNPHSTKAKDKQTADVPPSTSNQQVQQSEVQNPQSPDYRNRDTSATAPSGNANMDQAERQNPHHPDNRHKHDTANADQMSGMDHDAMMKNATPQQMLERLHMAGLHEIKMAKLAEKNGTDKVKSYAQTLQQDHQQADEQVKQLAKKKGVTLSDSPRNAEMKQRMDAMNDRFSNLKGPQFDRAFANAMSMEHKRLIDTAQAWRQDCKDQDVCSLIDTLLPKLEQHEQMANQLRGPSAQGRAPEPTR